MATDLVPKQQLLDGMQASMGEFLEAARSLPAERWSEGRYEEGWTARDILAHVASIEWTYPRILVLADQGPQETPTPEPKKGFRGGVGSYNQRQVEKRADATVEELIEEFERNRAATIAAVTEADEDLLRERVRSAGGIEGTAAEVLNYLTVIHLRGHLDDIRRGEP